jgi:RNA polymerase sigma-70 factor (ECF subfamily)
VATRVTDLRTEGDYRVLDDRLLVLDFQAGQPQAFVEIHRRYGPLAKHVCSRFLPNRHDADEAFQETMIRVFQGLHRFNGQYALQPWIARIATNVSLDQIRTRARRPQVEDSIEDHEHGDPADGPEEMVERLVERDLVISVLSGLPESHRTALVLREMEGRSHKEIALALDITPAQAKALIHRAKGSFRRRWLLAVTERGGLAGIALLPLIWMLRVADGARRIADKVGGQATQVAQAATPELVTSAASSPATVSAAASMTERVVAAGMTILVAGGVTVGAATIVKSRGDREQGQRAEAPAAVVVPVVTESPAAEPSPTAVGPERVEPSRTKPPKEEPEDPGTVVVPPVEDPAETPAEDPSPGADPSPSDDPSTSPTPDPTVVPAPAWSYAFTVSTESVESCDCPASSYSGPPRVERGDGGFRFSRVITGAAVDAVGDPTWPFYLLQEAQVGPSVAGGGSLEYRFGLGSGAGEFLYGGAAGLVETVEHENGSTTYRFEGTYSLSSPSTPLAGLPFRGFVAASVSVWEDGTFYAGSFSLTEAEPETPAEQPSPASVVI